MALFDLTLQTLCVSLLVHVYEGVSPEKQVKKIRRSLYLRRFSTGSMSIYVFSYLLGLVVRFVLPYDPRSVLNFYVVNVVQYVVQFLLFLWLDRADWIMTPDWLLSAGSKLISGKFRPREFASSSHLAIRPVGVFTKPDALSRNPKRVEMRNKRDGSSEGLLEGD